MNNYINGGYSDVGNNLITFSMAGKLRINKNASGGAVGVNVMSDKEIQVY